LKKQLIDREKRERELKKQFDDEGNLIKPMTEEVYQSKIQDKVATLQKERFANNLNANDEMKRRI